MPNCQVVSMELTDLLGNKDALNCAMYVGTALGMGALSIFYSRYSPNSITGSVHVGINAKQLRRIYQKQKIASVMYNIIHPLETYSRLRGKPSA